MPYPQYVKTRGEHMTSTLRFSFAGYAIVVLFFFSSIQDAKAWNPLNAGDGTYFMVCKDGTTFRYDGSLRMVSQLGSRLCRAHGGTLGVSKRMTVADLPDRTWINRCSPSDRSSQFGVSGDGNPILRCRFRADPSLLEGQLRAQGLTAGGIAQTGGASISGQAPQTDNDPGPNCFKVYRYTDYFRHPTMNRAQDFATTFRVATVDEPHPTCNYTTVVGLQLNVTVTERDYTVRFRGNDGSARETRFSGTNNPSTDYFNGLDPRGTWEILPSVETMLTIPFTLILE